MEDRMKQIIIDIPEGYRLPKGTKDLYSNKENGRCKYYNFDSGRWNMLSSQREPSSYFLIIILE
jgi:hypothetical protein